ncbi:MAG: glycosyltransferase family 39 protein [Polyangiaceae bacterium]
MSSTDPATPTRDPQRRWRLFVLISGIISIIAVQGPLIGYKTFANVDEAYAAALAERLLEGHKLYDGAISQRGPLMYYVFEAFAWIHGWDNVFALRLWALGLAIAHVLMTYWVGRTLVSKTAATVAAAVASYALAIGYPPEDAIAINGEPLQLPAMLVAVVLGVVAVRAAPGSRDRLIRLVACGIAFGIAVSIKQSVALHPIPVVMLLVIDGHRRRVKLSRVVLDTAVLFFATLLVPVLFIAHAAAQGTLSQMYYYCVTYNAQVHLRPSQTAFAWLTHFFFRLMSQTGFFMMLVVLVGRAIPYLLRRFTAARRLRSIYALGRGFGPREYLAVHLVLAIFAATSMYRFFPHYYLQAAPFMAICAGITVDRWFRAARTAKAARIVVSMFMCFVVFASAMGCVFGERIDGRVAHDRTVKDVAKYIEGTTKPEDRVFVWGFSPWIYEYSHRRPAGRYVFETYVTGFVPWFWEKLSFEKARIVPGSTELLLGDLDREKPAIVVDAGSVMMARPMRTYDKPNTWLHAHYCFEVRIGAMDIYRVKPDGGACPQPFFPRAHYTTDFLGRALTVPVASTLDIDTSPRLPEGDYFKPLWFPAGPKPPGLEAIRDLKREKEEAEGAKEGFFVQGMEPYLPPVLVTPKNAPPPPVP